MHTQPASPLTLLVLFAVGILVVSLAASVIISIIKREPQWFFRSGLGWVVFVLTLVILPRLVPV